MGRERAKVWVSFMFPDDFEGGRPRRFLVGMAVFGTLDGPEDGGRVETGAVDGCSVGCCWL